MRYALNQSTLYATACEEFFNAAGEAKFDGVEVRHEIVANYLSSSDNASYSALRDSLASNALELASVNALEFFNLCDDIEFRKRVTSQCQFMCEIAYKLECDLIVAIPSFYPDDLDSSEIRQDKVIAKTQDRLRKVAKIAQAQDVNVGLEFLGFPTNSIQTLQLARQIVEPLFSTAENTGFVIDTFHFLVGGCELDDLTGIDRLFMVHVNDLPYTPGEDLTVKQDTDRVFPGEGNFDFNGFFHALNKQHYQKWYSIELFDTNQYIEPPSEIALKAKNSLQSVYNSVIQENW